MYRRSEETTDRSWGASFGVSPGSSNPDRGSRGRREVIHEAGRETMTLRERIGRALLRWRPWPQVVIYGGGGVLLIVSALFWLEPDRTFRYWFRLVIGTLLILGAALDVWLVWMERRQESAG